MKKNILIFILMCVAFFIPTSQAYANTGNTDVTIGVNETIELSEFFPELNNDSYNIEYRNSDTNIGVVDTEKNTLTGVACGTGHLEIYFYDESISTDDDIASSYLEKVCELTYTVKNGPSTITLNKTSITVGVGENFKITPNLNGGVSCKKIFTSSNSKIATVDSNGNVKALSAGTANIIFSTYNKTVNCKVTVKNAPSKVNVAATHYIQLGTSTHKVNYTFPSNTYSSKVTLKIANTKIAKISSNGIITGLKKGDTTLTISTHSSTTKCTIRVTDNALVLNRESAQIAYDYSNVIRKQYGTSAMGKPLEAYEIYNKSKNNKYKKTLFMNFAIHGFEDSYAKDGKLLVAEANALIKYYANNSNLLNNYRLVIIPCANPDGTINGKNNKRSGSTAFGRCTSKHIDMNRDFIAFKAKESRALRNFTKKEKPSICLDFRGWLNESIGTSTLNRIIKSNLGLRKTLNNQYVTSSGYFIGWAHKTFSIPAALIEYKNTKSISTSKDVKMLNTIIRKYR